MLKKELEVFKSQSKNVRILLSAFMLYAFVMPVMNVFVGSYIMRNSQDVGKVVLYQLMIYTGIPVTAWLNGYLLNRMKGSWLYAAGMFLSGISMFVMTSIKSLDNTGIAVAGLLMGGAAGLFWSNRNYLVLKSTTDGTAIIIRDSNPLWEPSVVSSSPCLSAGRLRSPQNCLPRQM